MQINRFQEAGDFYNRARSYLLEREAEHNLTLGLCAVLIEQPGYYQYPAYLAVVEDDDGIVGTALMTPPHNLVLSHIRNPAAHALIADDVYASYKTLPGISGKPEICQEFAAQWQQLTGQTHSRSMAQRIYQLEKVSPISGVSGQMRRATEADRKLLLDWTMAFSREALGEAEADISRLERTVNLMLTSKLRGAYLWEDGEPVSFAAYGGPTPHGIRIGPVYTPPGFRGHGYASACVADLSQYLLDSGRKFVFLFTDLANPTSNHIYQNIGYNPVCDIDIYDFKSAPSA